MKRHKVLKVVFILLIAVFVIFLYELIGICVEYRHPPEISEQTKQKFQLEEFRKETKSLERTAIIEENEDALMQRIRLIESAESNLILSTFSFHADDSGRIMIGALLNAADRGVKIRILVDGFESWASMEGNPYFYAASSHPNIEIKLYNRLNPLKPWKTMGRMHDKYLIADGRNYILGGRNISNNSLGNYPGVKNVDRDVLVICENPTEENSVCHLSSYFENIWKEKDCRYFHENNDLAKRKSVKTTMQDAKEEYQTYYRKNQVQIDDRDYTKDTCETTKVTLLTNPTHTGVKEPILWYQLGMLMKNAEERVKIHTPYIICDDMMYNTWKQTADAVSEFTVLTNSAANNGNLFGSADYMKNKGKIFDTGVQIWEYEGGRSYHGKSVLIDSDLSIIGSFNMDMRSTYLDTELMLVVCSDEINEQLEKNMMKYERVSRQAMKDGTYYNPYDIEPMELREGHQWCIAFLQRMLGWARFLF